MSNLLQAKFMLRTIIATNDPTAPIVIERAHSSIVRLGGLMAGAKGVDKDKVREIAAKLISAWPVEAELNAVSCSTEFLVAVAGMIATSLEMWVEELPEADIESAMPESGVN